MTTKSKMFQPLRKNSKGLGQYAAIRMPSSTMKTATQAALIASSSDPQRSSSSSYVWRPSTTALTAIVPTTTAVKGVESTIRAAVFPRGAGTGTRLSLPSRG